MTTRKTEVLPALTNNPDLNETQSLSTGLTGFLAGMVPFFAKAAILESDARRRLKAAEATQLPTTVEEHEALQVAAKQARAGKKATEEHWHIAQIANRLHKCLTGGRKRATDLDDAAFERLNKLNNQFLIAQRQKAEAEESRRRDEAERIERERRQAEAAELERQAVEAEANAATLSERQRVFVAYVVNEVTPYEAAQRVGYLNPGKQCVALMVQPKILAAIESGTQARAIREQAAALEAAPVAVAVEEVKPEVGTAAGTVTRWKATCTDFAAAIAALKAGSIPADVFEIDQVALNRYATALRSDLNNWPGFTCEPETRLR